MTEDQTPVVSDPIAVDVMNDPLRSRIYQQVLVPKSATELAAIFGLRAGRLYYHLKLLERHGCDRAVQVRVEIADPTALPSRVDTGERLRHDIVGPVGITADEPREPGDDCAPSREERGEIVAGRHRRVRDGAKPSIFDHDGHHLQTPAIPKRLSPARRAWPHQSDELARRLEPPARLDQEN